MLSSNESCQTESQNMCQKSISLNKVKPWVFRPKKVIYSLQGGNPGKKQFSTSHWSQEQNDRYVQFLLKFKSVVEGGKKNRRKWHLNRIMSKAIGTRSHEQCRSHHQKMMKHYKTIDGILQHFDKSQAEPTSTEHVEVELEKQPAPLEQPLIQEQEYWNWESADFSVDVKLPFFINEEPLI